MADLIAVFGSPFSPPPSKIVLPPEQQLIDAIRSAGLEPPDHVTLDGRLHRFRSGTKGSSKAGDKSGWYVAFGDGVPAGRFGCWRLGLESPWRADVGRDLTPAEEMAHVRRAAEAKALRDAELARQHEVAASTVETIWENAAPASADHPYLKRKGVQPHGARITGDGRLMLPLFGADGKLSSLQYIDAEGRKLYHPGAEAGGKFWIVGTLDTPGALYVAEGFATAATVHEVTGRPCAVAYSASSLPTVTGALRELYGEAQDMVIVADHDAHGVGQKYADQASAKYGARVVMPPIEGMDANDYLQSGHDLAGLLAMPSGAEVIRKMETLFGDQLGTDYEAPDELVEGLFVIGETTVLYGDSNSGKTFWALSVATAIANGTECYGRMTDPGLVVYLASEAPASIRARMQAIKKFYGCSLENLAMVPVPLNFHESPQDALDVIDLVRAIEESKGKKVRLIIADTLSRMSAGANENSGEDMGPVMARFESVAKTTGAALMIIHHTGKDAAKGARGWSGIRAHIDTEIEVIEKEGTRFITITKQRVLPSKYEVIYFKLEVIEMGVTKFGKPATTCVAVHDTEATPAPETKKSPNRNIEFMRTIERCWWASGTEEREGMPYISRSALHSLLVQDGATERSARLQANPATAGGLVGSLLNDGLITSYEHGWIVTDPASASVLMLRKGDGETT
jgi:phage/plasmid primase-like uncharacterized protein/KaiC/GvpD/RAD55 family RecA-like ATPase